LSRSIVIVPLSQGNNIKQGKLRNALSANIRARRESLKISQERLAELADVSIQMIKSIEGRQTWVSDAMLEKLAGALGVSAFQLLVPVDEAVLIDDNALTAAILHNLRQNIHDDINSRFDHLQAKN
jgi:transcriptional regulator with XRE-family HTH domain